MVGLIVSSTSNIPEDLVIFKKHLQKVVVSVSRLFGGFAPVEHFGHEQQPGLGSVPPTNPEVGCSLPNLRALSNSALTSRRKTKGPPQELEVLA